MVLFPVFLLILNNNQTQMETDYFIYYFLASIGISLRGFGWYSNSLIARFSVANFGYISSLIGITTPIFYILLRKPPFNLNLIIALGLSGILTSLTLIIFFDIVRKSLILKRKNQFN